eukprot:gene43108-53505_t
MGDMETSDVGYPLEWFAPGVRNRETIKLISNLKSTVALLTSSHKANDKSQTGKVEGAEIESVVYSKDVQLAD